MLIIKTLVNTEKYKEDKIIHPETSILGEILKVFCLFISVTIDISLNQDSDHIGYTTLCCLLSKLHIKNFPIFLVFENMTVNGLIIFC